METEHCSHIVLGTDYRCDLSVANYKYDDDKVLWTKGKNDTDYSAKEKDKDPTKGQKEKQNYTPAKWDIEKYVTTSKLIHAAVSFKSQLISSFLKDCFTKIFFI